MPDHFQAPAPTRRLTPKRVEALRYIGRHPGYPVGRVAENVLAYVRADGTIRPMAAQAATRNGAGYCKQLAAMGLVKIKLTTHGYGDVTLTEAGRRVVADADAQAESDAGSLDAVLARCLAGDAP